ncbi:MAG: SDR family oxidoreductase, partial [Planctomycetaceae bacterium]
MALDPARAAARRWNGPLPLVARLNAGFVRNPKSWIAPQLDAGSLRSWTLDRGAIHDYQTLPGDSQRLALCADRESSGMNSHRILLTGATGRLGSYVARELESRALETDYWSGSGAATPSGRPTNAVDLADESTVRLAFAETRPEIVLHVGALATAEACRANPQRARRVNEQATGLLAELAQSAGARLVYTSTDLVFDGEQGNYRESDSPAPIMQYGQSKAAGEQRVLKRPLAVVVRLALLYGPKLGDRDSFFDLQLQAIATRDRRMNLFIDEWRTPLDYVTAAQALVDIALHNVTGILHVGGPERMSRFEMGIRLAERLGCREPPFDPVTRDAIPGSEPRPRDVSLDSSRWREL